MSPPVACVSDTVQFLITYTNTGEIPISGVRITDTYDVRYLESLDPWGPGDGQIIRQWVYMGGNALAPGDTGFFAMAFHALTATATTMNTVEFRGGSAAGAATGIDTASVSIVAPGPCSGNVVANGGFESALAGSWHVAMGTLPVLTTEEPHGGASSVRLGSGSAPSLPGVSGVMQPVAIPNNAAHAPA